MKRVSRMLLGTLIGIAGVEIAGVVSADPPIGPMTATTAPAATTPTAEAQAAIDKGLLWLKKQQNPASAGDLALTWQNKNDPPALTAIVLKAFMDDTSGKYDPDDHFLDAAFDKLLSYQKADGSISEDVLPVYNTAIAISALADSHEAEYKDKIAKAVAYLKSIQWGDTIQGVPLVSQKVGPNDANYGGWGYGKTGRADGSNEQIALDALHDAGLPSNDPAFKQALKFVTHLQNHSETNDLKWAGNDGGFIYFPSGNGASAAGAFTAADGKPELRSYGSMTYAGLKSMIYAGLTKDDPRVQAAMAWIGKNWTLDENPGMQFSNPSDPNAGQAGLFYYHHTLSRALRAFGQPIIVDAQGNKHDWRVELIAKLISEQQPDGNFKGTQKWMESNPNLATAYAVLSLEEAHADLKDHPEAGK